MSNLEYDNEYYEIDDLHPDEIEEKSFSDILNESRISTRQTFIDPLLKGGRLLLGSGSSTMQFKEGVGLWLGNSDFSSAPFKVDMDGNLVANSATITGTITADSGSDVDWSYISSVEIENADILDATIEAAKIASLDADDINTGTLSASYIEVGSITITDLNNAGDMSTKNKVSDTDCDTTIIEDGKIITGLLTADRIQTGTLDASQVNVDNLTASDIEAGTLTGSTFQTKSDYERIEIDSSNHWLRFYDSSGNEEGRITSDASDDYFIIGTGMSSNAIIFTLDLDEGFTGYPMKIDSSGTHTSHIYPQATGTYNLGGSGKYWNTLYVDTIEVASDINGVDNINGHWVGNIDLGDSNSYDILPNSDDQGQLGYRAGEGGQSSDRRWSLISANNIYGNNVYSSDGTIGSYDTHPDIEMIKAVGTKKQKKGKRDSWDLSGLPDDVEKDGQVNIAQLNGLLLGTLKELIEKVEKLEEKVK